MAALDFPNPPLTVGQLYNGTNGVTYQWDGTVWTVPLGGAQLWSVSGAALTPVDTTKYLAVPGSSTLGTIIAGSTRTIKTRLVAHPTADSAYFMINRDFTTVDDASKPAWFLGIQAGGDNCIIGRAAAGAGTTSTNLLALD